MDDMVDTRTKTCEACQPATPIHTRDPLKPTTAPTKPFVKVAADHWGPTPDGKYLLVVIDLLSRFPEVAVVKGTSAEANIQAFDDIFSRHFPPKLLLTDGGPPFNTGPDHPLQVYFKKLGITHRPTFAAEDPEANGTCEAFMKHLKKVWHTSTTQHRDPILDLNRHLRSFQSTPHPTTGHIPAEILFGRKVNTIMPDLRTDPAEGREDIADARHKDKLAKEVMKKYKDRPANVRPHTISIGDKVLLRQKSTKKNPPHDPDPYTVTDVQGTQITAVRHGHPKTRDSQRFKRVEIPQPPRFRNLPSVLQSNPQKDSDPDIGPPRTTPPAPTSHPPAHAPQQDAHAPDQGDPHPHQLVHHKPRHQRERWSFIQPATWEAPARQQPMTRALQRRRKKARENVKGGSGE